MSFVVLIKNVLLRSLDIIVQPWLHPEGIWMIIPLVLILVLIHLYFGRHRSEELGWNSAFGNTISLLWVCVLLFRFIFEQHGLIMVKNAPQEFWLVTGLTLWVVLMLLFNFFHKMPKRMAYIFSSADLVYILAYIAIGLVLTDIPLTIETLYASIFVFIVLVVLLESIKNVMPMTQSAKHVIAAREKRKKKKKAIEKGVRTRKRRAFWRGLWGKD